MYWSRGIIDKIDLENDYLEILYLFDLENKKTVQLKDSYNIAPFRSKSVQFQWRMNLAPGDLVDCQDDFEGWYNATVM